MVKHQLVKYIVYLIITNLSELEVLGNMKIIRYKCPYCKCYTNKMELLKTKYKPNAKEMKEHPNVAGELLKCKCNRILKWIEMEKVEYDDMD